MVAHEKTDGQYIERQRAATTSDSESQRAVQQAPQRDTTSANEVVQQETMSAKELTSANEWQRVAILANLSFFPIREEPTTINPKEAF